MQIVSRSIRTQTCYWRVRAALVLIAILALPVEVQSATFTPLGYLPEGYFYSGAFDVSGDGLVVVGSAHRGGVGNEAFRWTAATGMQGIGDLPTGDFHSIATSVFHDGSVIIGRATADDSALDDAFHWTAAEGMQAMGYLSNSSRPYSYGLSVSGDGAIAVGTSGSEPGNQAFRWVEATGMTGLGDLSGGRFESYANDISADGRVIVGESQSNEALEPFFWTVDQGMVGIGFLPGHVTESHAWAISDDGTTIVGDDGYTGWRWAAATGLTPIPPVTGQGSLAVPADVSADGATIVGATTHNGPWDEMPAFIWTADRGTENLQHFLEEEFGLILDGWLLTHASGISDDGSVIVGTGMNPAGRPEAWVINLSVPEPAAGAWFTPLLFVLSLFRGRHLSTSTSSTPKCGH